jgi:CHAT domain
MSEQLVKKILILPANPKDTNRLRLDQEVREIKEGLRRSQLRDRFILETRWAVRPRDIQRAILDVQPNIIHFSGHGMEEGLALEDETGKTRLVSAEALAGLFELFSDQVECVLLNGCYSQIQATAIAQHIPYVIGMNQGICAHASVQFAVGFYKALTFVRSIEQAYQFGCVEIHLENIPEYMTPVLLKRGEVKLQRYDQALKQYEEEFSKAVQQKYPLSQETRHELECLRSD